MVLNWLQCCLVQNVRVQCEVQMQPEHVLQPSGAAWAHSAPGTVQD